MIWRCHQRRWLRLHMSSDARTTMEVVMTREEPEVMWNHEMYSLLVQVIWTPKRRACENLVVRWICKDPSQRHDFDWEVSLLVPGPGGRRSVSVSASRYPTPFCTSDIPTIRTNLGRCSASGLHVFDYIAMLQTICIICSNPCVSLCVPKDKAFSFYSFSRGRKMHVPRLCCTRESWV